jgi:hypothetical protein
MPPLASLADKVPERLCALPSLRALQTNSICIPANWEENHRRQGKQAKQRILSTALLNHKPGTSQSSRSSLIRLTRLHPPPRLPHLDLS